MVFIPSLFWFSPFKCWVIRFSKWVSNLQQKFWKVLFYSASAEIEPAFILLNSTFWGDYCLLKRKSSCWHQWGTHHFVLLLEHRLIQSKSPNTRAHTNFFVCFTLQLSITFLTLIQKWPRLKIHLEVSMSLEQIIHWQNEAYSKARNTNASSLPSFCPIQCSVQGVWVSFVFSGEFCVSRNCCSDKADS